MKTLSPQTKRTPERKPATTRPVAPTQQPTTASPRARMGSAAGPAMKTAAGGAFKAKAPPTAAPNPKVRLPKK
ncbi:Lipoprotein [Corallococcus soli]